MVFSIANYCAVFFVKRYVRLNNIRRCEENDPSCQCPTVDELCLCPLSSMGYQFFYFLLADLVVCLGPYRLRG